MEARSTTVLQLDMVPGKFLQCFGATVSHTGPQLLRLWPWKAAHVWLLRGVLLSSPRAGDCPAAAQTL
eukprot:1161714-Pelagomonas_calceolata.AAC.5